MAHDALDMAASAAAAVIFLVVERDDGVSALPDALGEGVAAVAYASAERPDADERVQLADRGGEAGGDSVGVVEDVDEGVEALVAQFRVEEFGDTLALELGEMVRTRLEA
jgi:hypothetical protein